MDTTLGQILFVSFAQIGSLGLGAIEGDLCAPSIQAEQAWVGLEWGWHASYQEARVGVQVVWRRLEQALDHNQRPGNGWRKTKKKQVRIAPREFCFLNLKTIFKKIDKFLCVSEYLINGYIFYKPKLQKICGDEKSGLEKCAHLGPRWYSSVERHGTEAQCHHIDQSHKSSIRVL